MTGDLRPLFGPRPIATPRAVLRRALRTRAVHGSFAEDSAAWEIPQIEDLRKRLGTTPYVLTADGITSFYAGERASWRAAHARNAYMQDSGVMLIDAAEHFVRSSGKVTPRAHVPRWWFHTRRAAKRFGTLIADHGGAAPGAGLEEGCKLSLPHPIDAVELLNALHSAKPWQVYLAVLKGAKFNPALLHDRAVAHTIVALLHEPTLPAAPQYAVNVEAKPTIKFDGSPVYETLRFSGPAISTPTWERRSSLVPNLLLDVTRGDVEGLRLSA